MIKCLLVHKLDVEIVYHNKWACSFVHKQLHDPMGMHDDTTFTPSTDVTTHMKCFSFRAGYSRYVHTYTSNPKLQLELHWQY